MNNSVIMSILCLLVILVFVFPYFMMYVNLIISMREIEKIEKNDTEAFEKLKEEALKNAIGFFKGGAK